MAHEIDTTTGKAAIFVTGQPAWHKLGTVVDKAQTSAEAIKLAGLDWTVTKEPCFTAIDGKVTDLPTTFATVRSDTKAVLGVVGSAYRPFQNVEAFDFMDALVGEKLAMFETAGSLKGGRRVWCLARIPGEYRIAGDDIVKPYCLLTSGHDGVNPIRMLPTTVRVVCWNTLSLAIGRRYSSEGISVQHNSNIETRIAEARTKLGIIAKRLSDFELQAQAMAKKTLSQEQLAAYFAQLVKDRSEKQQKTLMETFFENLHNERNTLKGIKGSAWAAYNAVSEYADHQLGGSTNGDLGKLDSRLNSIWFGTSNAVKQSAFEAALALAV